MIGIQLWISSCASVPSQRCTNFRTASLSNMEWLCTSSNLALFSWIVAFSTINFSLSLTRLPFLKCLTSLIDFNRLLPKTLRIFLHFNRSFPRHRYSFRAFRSVFSLTCSFLMDWWRTSWLRHLNFESCNCWIACWCYYCKALLMLKFSEFFSIISLSSKYACFQWTLFSKLATSILTCVALGNKLLFPSSTSNIFSPNELMR